MITDPPPKKLASQLEGLERALDEEIPRKHSGRNVLIASWNLREFGGLTERWLSRGEDTPKRDLFSL
ncbi:MAG: endonuclease, partial [Actinobacteria bacterium]|nr:endonuclease [Actinomycetota bacterium]